MAIELVTATGVVIIADLLAYREYLRYKYALERQKTTPQTQRNTLEIMHTINSEINEPAPIQNTQIASIEETQITNIQPDRVETVFVPDYTTLSQLQTLKLENTQLKAQIATNPNWDKMLMHELNKIDDKMDDVAERVTNAKNKLN